MSENTEVERPQIHIVFDSATMGVQVGTKGFTNLDFALGMLEMAKVALNFQRNIIVAQQVDAQQNEARRAQAEGQAVAERLRRNGGLIR